MKNLVKRALVAGMLAATMTVSLIGCGGTSSGTTSSSAGGDAAASTATSTAAETAEEEATEEATEEAGGAEAAVAEYAAANGDVKMALVAGNSGGTFWGPIEEQFLAECETLGWKGEYLAPAGTEGGTAEIQQLCDQALSQGYNVIAAVMNDNDVFEDFRTRAAEQGVLVLAFNSNPGEDLVPAMVGIDSYNSGWQQGEKIAEYAEEMGLETIKYISACTSLSMAPQQQTKQGVIDAIEANTDIPLEELGETESNGSAATAQDQIGATYIAHPDVNTIFCIEAYSAVGAGAFIEENSLQGKVICCGLALDADAFRRVQSGAWTATSSVDVEWMGRQIADVADAILKGEEVEYGNYPDKIWVTNEEEIKAYCEEHNIEM